MRYTLRLLRAVNGRSFVRQPARTLLTITGVAAAVALAVALPAVSTSMVGALDDASRATAGTANLELRPAAAVGMPQGIVDEARRIDGVEVASATIERETKLRAGRQVVRALLVGGDAAMLELAPRGVDEPRVQIADPSGLMIPEALAAELGVSPGDAVDVTTPAGWRTARIGGVVGGTGFSARLAAGPLDVVQDLFGMPGRVDAVYIRTPDPDATLAALHRTLGDRVRAGRVGIQQRDIRQLQAITETGLRSGGLAVLVAGALLVFNTMSVAAAERARETAVLRAIGASRAQIAGLFTFDGLVLGTIGSLAGLAGGIGIARVIVATRGPLFEDVFQITVTRVVLAPGDLVLAVAGGIAAALVATLVAAAGLVRVPPVSAMGPTPAATPPRLPSRRARSMGVALGAIGLLAMWRFVATSGAGFYSVLATGLVMCGMLLVLPWLVTVSARRLGRLLRSHRTGVARIGVGEITRAPHRAAYTTAALALGLGIAIATGAPVASFVAANRALLESEFRSDLVVRPDVAAGLGASFLLDDAVADEIASVPGVAGVYRGRGMVASVQGITTLVTAVEWDRRAGLSVHTGDVRARAMADDLPDTRNAYVSASFLRQFAVGVGESFTLTLPQGPAELRIAGVYGFVFDYNPAIFVDYGTLARLTGARESSTVAVGVAAGADPLAVRGGILQALGRRHDVAVDTRMEFIDGIDRLVRQVTDAYSVLSVGGAGLAFVILVNTLLLSTIARTREFGVLRAIGLLRRQVAELVASESLALAVIGVALAALLGTMIGLVGLAAMRQLLGIDIAYSAQPVAYLLAALLGVTGALVAAVYPAYRASRVNTASSVHHE